MMSKEKDKKVDILSDLLNSPQNHFVAELDALNDLISQTSAIIGAPHQSTHGGPAEPGDLPKKPKIKSTCYISQDLFNRLDEVQKRIKQMVPEPLRGYVSKSQIINQSLAITLQDYEEKGDASLLTRTLVKKFNPKTE